MRDAVVFQPSDAEAVAQGVSRVHRIAAAVVAPTLDAAAIVAAMARSVDPVFLPRPLLLVPALPRNELGKTGRAQLLQLLRAGASRDQPVMPKCAASISTTSSRRQISAPSTRNWACAGSRARR